MPSLSQSAVRGQQMYLGYAPPPPDPLPPVPDRLASLLADIPPDRHITVRVRTVAEMRLWLAAARPGDRAEYGCMDEPLLCARERDPALSALADEALKQSDAKDVPLRSACRHVRGRMNGHCRVHLHTRQLPLGLGVVCFMVRSAPPLAPRSCYNARHAA